MTTAKYAKQRGGIGRYAVCTITSVVTHEVNSLVVDNCSWEAIKNIYANPSVTPYHLNWKQSAINGMQFAIGRITLHGVRTFALIDINSHVVHTDCVAMFVAGFLSVFEEMQIHLSEGDLRLLNLFIESERFSNDVVFQIPIELGKYQAS